MTNNRHIAHRKYLMPPVSRINIFPNVVFRKSTFFILRRYRISALRKRNGLSILESKICFQRNIPLVVILKRKFSRRCANQIYLPLLGVNLKPLSGIRCHRLIEWKQRKFLPVRRIFDNLSIGRISGNAKNKPRPLRSRIVDQKRSICHARRRRHLRFRNQIRTVIHLFPCPQKLLCQLAKRIICRKMNRKLARMQRLPIFCIAVIFKLDLCRRHNVIVYVRSFIKKQPSTRAPVQPADDLLHRLFVYVFVITGQVKLLGRLPVPKVISAVSCLKVLRKLLILAHHVRDLVFVRYVITTKIFRRFAAVCKRHRLHFLLPCVLVKGAAPKDGPVLYHHDFRIPPTALVLLNPFIIASPTLRAISS